MNSAELSKMMKKLSLPDYFIKKGRLAYYTIEQDDLKVMVGVYLDTSIDKESFLAEYFIQPLFVEFPTFVFTIGKRVGNYWNEESAAGLPAELSKIKKINSIDEVITFIEKNYDLDDNPYLVQSAAYLHFLKKNYDKTLSILKKLIRSKSNDIPDWKLLEIKKAEKFYELVEKKNFQEAQDSLVEWQQATMKSLKVT